MRQLLGTHELEVVCRRVVLRVLAIRRTGQAAHCQVEPRRAVLSLIVSVRNEIEQAVRATVLEHMTRSSVSQRVTALAAFVSKAAAVTETAQHQTALDSVDTHRVVREPGDRSDRSRNKEEAIAQSPWTFGESAREIGSDRHPGQVVVRQRRMAAVTGEQNFVGALSRQVQLSPIQMSWRERTVDADVVNVVRQIHKVSVRETEAPAFPIVRSAIRNPVWPFRQREEVRTELVQGHLRSYRRAVVHDVQIVPAKVDDALSF